MHYCHRKQSFNSCVHIAWTCVSVCAPKYVQVLVPCGKNIPCYVHPQVQVQKSTRLDFSTHSEYVIHITVHLGGVMVTCTKWHNQLSGQKMPWLSMCNFLKNASTELDISTCHKGIASNDAHALHPTGSASLNFWQKLTSSHPWSEFAGAERVVGSGTAPVDKSWAAALEWCMPGGSHTDPQWSGSSTLVASCWPGSGMWPTGNYLPGYGSQMSKNKSQFK